MVVCVTGTFAAAPAAVWTIVGDFEHLDRWHPDLVSVEHGVNDGKPIRTAQFDGWWLTEQLEERDTIMPSLTYAVVAGSRPNIIGSRTTIALSSHGDDGCKLTWTVHGDGDSEMLNAYLRERLNHLRLALPMPGEKG